MTETPSYKIVIIGESGVGKSSLMSQFIHKKTEDHFSSTIGIDFSVGYIRVKVNEKDCFRIQLKIFDTAGQKKFRAITEHYQASNVDGMIAVYDITNENSLCEMETFITRAREISHLGESLPLILVGNKSDLEKKRQITTSKGEEFAEIHEIPKFLEISAKMSYKDCEQVFMTIAEQIHNNRLLDVDLSDDTLDSSSEKSDHNYGKILVDFLAALFLCR